VPIAAIQDYNEAETADLVTRATKEPWGGDREAMTRAAAAQGAKLIVSSEEDLGSNFAPDDPKDATRKLAQALGASLVVGYASADQPLPYNSAAFVSPSGDIAGVYHKQHLYLGEGRGLRAGSTSPTFATPIGRVGMEICFDSCYSDVTRALARHGAQLIAMPNFDPPTPRGVLHHLHTTMMPFRAVENRVPFVRCDSNGRSMLVQPDGAIVAEGPLYQAAVLSGKLRLGDGHGTFYTRTGDWLAYLCAIVAAVALLSRRSKRPPHAPA